MTHVPHIGVRKQSKSFSFFDGDKNPHWKRLHVGPKRRASWDGCAMGDAGENPSALDRRV